MDIRYTRQQVARGSRADAIDEARWYLFKKVSRLRLTYQIRLLTFGAGESGARLLIRVPKRCEVSAPLRDFLRDNKEFVRMERV